MKLVATYVSVWDGGTEISTPCFFDTEKNLAFDIESTDENIEDLDILDREYIELQDGTQIDTFTTDEDRNVVNGEFIDEPVSEETINKLADLAKKLTTDSYKIGTFYKK